MKNISIFIILLLFSSCAVNFSIGDSGKSEENMNELLKDDKPMSGYVLDEDKYTAMVDQFMSAYRKNDMSSAKEIFSEGAVFWVNDTKMFAEDAVNAFGEGHKYFDNINHSDVYSATMYYNDNKIYTNVWYKWSGASKKSGETIEAKGYAWFRWENGKAVEAYNAFDPTAYNAAMSLE
jgi:hypothetical protein